MTTIIPNEGLDWIANKAIEANGTEDEVMYSIAVGDGTSSPSSSDTQLDNELHRATTESSTVSIQKQSGVGEIDATVSVSGGTEVPAGTDITEFAIFARDPSINDGNVTESDDVLVYREVRSAVTVEAGDRKTFSIPYDITE